MGTHAYVEIDYNPLTKREMDRLPCPDATALTSTLRNSETNPEVAAIRVFTLGRTIEWQRIKVDSQAPPPADLTPIVLPATGAGSGAVPVVPQAPFST